MGNSSQKHIVTYHPRQGFGPRVKKEEYDIVFFPGTPYAQMHGVYKSWYPNGQICRLKFYDHGVQVDRDIWWAPDGKLCKVSKQASEEDEATPQGERKTKGKRVHRIWYYEDGTPKYEYTDQAGTPLSPYPVKDSQNRILVDAYADGVFREWSQEGILLHEDTYKSGKEHGVCKTWRGNGTLSFEFHYTEGVLDGDCREYYENGIKKATYTLRPPPIDIDLETKPVLSVRVGPRNEWHDNGYPKLECTYDARGRLTGTYTEWHPDGTVRVVGDFTRGKAVRVLSLRDESGRDCLLPAGEQIVWKACTTTAEKTAVDVYVKIMVPDEARRVTPVDTNKTYKSRVSHGVVLAIESEDAKHYDSAVSFVYTKERLTYVVGERVAVDPDDFDDDPDVECGAGINVHRYRDQCTQWFKKL